MMQTPLTYGNVVCNLAQTVSSRNHPLIRDQCPSTESRTIRPTQQDLKTHMLFNCVKFVTLLPHNSFILEHW